MAFLVDNLFWGDLLVDDLDLGGHLFWMTTVWDHPAQLLNSTWFLITLGMTVFAGTVLCSHKGLTVLVACICYTFLGDFFCWSFLESFYLVLHSS